MTIQKSPKKHKIDFIKEKNSKNFHAVCGYETKNENEAKLKRRWADVDCNLCLQSKENYEKRVKKNE